MPGLEHFRDKEDYRKWLAYRHIHGIPSKSKSVSVGGKIHAINHSKRRKPRRKGGKRK